MKFKKIIFSVIAAITIFAANLILVKPLFSGQFTREMGSIESIFIADAQFIYDNFPHLSWQPYWYAGFPFHLFYTPLLPFLMAGLHALSPLVAISSWYRILVGLFYALTPVSLYFLLSYLTERKMLGFVGALGYSFLPSLAYLMPQVGGLASIYDGAPWQILTLILFGEGGHIVGLFFLPLALLFLLKAIRNNSPRDIILASIFIALLALTNIIALIGFAVMAAVTLMVELLQGSGSRKLVSFGLVTGMSIGLSAFWYNLSFIKASFSIGTGGVKGGVGEAYLPFIPLLFLLIPLLWLLAIVGKSKKFRLFLLGGGWVMIFFLAAYFWFKSQTMLLPQPNRYLPEMSMGVALLLVVALNLLAKNKNIIYIFVSALILYSPLRYIKSIWQLTAPHPEIENTAEFRTARWLAENTREERIYASGSTAFWLNTFPFSSHLPQIRGGNDGVVNPWWLHAIYQINTADNAPLGKEGLLSVNWLKILNASYLIVNFPDSKEVFHDFRSPERFSAVEGVEEVVNLSGDVVYKIPLNQPSLAQIVNSDKFRTLAKPKNAVDFPAVKAYADYIDGEAKNDCQFRWMVNGQAVVKADLKGKEGIGLQITHNSGWQAFLDGEKVAIKKDVLGFMFLLPGKTGPVEINLKYAPTWDIWFGYCLTFLTIGGIIFYAKKNH